MNEEHAAQCKVCGAKFESYCGSCGKANPSAAKFCLHCGVSISKKQEKAELEETRRQVAVMFADVSGFTKLSEELDPEEVRDIINGAFQYILRPVYELGGTIDKYIGDCVMVLFGAKHSHKDDAARALKCSLEMKRLIQEYSDEKLHSTGMNLELSIGVNYGMVVTGQVGNYYDKDYTVIGDVVNTAQRLQVSANASEILVSESVYLDTVDITDYSEVREIALKNKSKLEKVYSPISIKSNLADASGFIERTDEIRQIDEIMLSNNKLCLINGESGLGKTTVVKEFLSHTSEEIKKIWINTNGMLRNKPYGLVSNIILGILNVGQDDSIRIKENRLRSFLDFVLVGFEEIEVVRSYNFLALISGLPLDSEYSSLINSMEYSDLKNEIETQINYFFSKLSVRQSMIIVVEDMLQADKESLMLINEIDFSTQMLLGIAQSNVVELTNAKLIELKRFDLDKTSRLIQSKIDATMENESVMVLFELSGGNPMLTLELLAAARRRGLLIPGTVYKLKENAIKVLPSSITGLVLSRLDDLMKNQLEFLKVASVIGVEFSLEWIEEIIDLDEEVIQELTNQNLIEFRRFINPTRLDGKIYGFTQNIIKDVVYNNMLTKDRVNLHKMVAETLDKLQLDEVYDILGHHYEMASLLNLAADNYYLYAKQLKETYNYPTAITYFERVISIGKNSKYYHKAFIRSLELAVVTSDFEKATEIIEKSNSIQFSEDEGLEFSLLHAKLLKEQAKFEQSLEIVGHLENELNNKSNLMGRLLQLKTSIYLMTGRPEMIDIAKQSEVILSKSRDYESLADTMSFAGIGLFMQGDLEEAILYLKKGYDYANLSKNYASISKISINLGIIYHASGEVTKSYEYLHEAIDAALKVGSVKNYVSAAINLGVFYMEKGKFKKAEPLFRETLEKATSNGLVYQKCISLTNLADLKYEMGLFEEAIHLYSDSLKVSKEYSLLYEEGVNNLSLGKVMYKLGQDGHNHLESAFEIFVKTDELGNLSDYYRIKSKYDSDDAIRDIDLALDYAKQSKSEIKELISLSMKGSLLEDIDYFQKAKEIALRIESEYEYAKILFNEYKTLNNKSVINELKDIIHDFDKCRLTDVIEKVIKEEY